MKFPGISKDLSVQFERFVDRLHYWLGTKNLQRWTEENVKVPVNQRIKEALGNLTPYYVI